MNKASGKGCPCRTLGLDAELFCFLDLKLGPVTKALTKHIIDCWDVLRLALFEVPCNLYLIH
jgi:hypothetical protein